MDLKELLLTAAAGIWSFFTVYFIYAKTKSDNDLKDFKTLNKENITSVDNKVTQVAKELNLITQKQVEHELSFVTEKHVREILKEEVKDIKADISTVKGNVSTILESLQKLNIAIGIQNGLREKEIQREYRERGGNENPNSR